jgi:hypothetical protein
MLPVMFIRYFVEIDHPFEVVEVTLLDDRSGGSRGWPRTRVP